jgi:hypothetical protein
VTSRENSNRLGLALEPCHDGKSERIVGIDPAGRVARAQTKIALGQILIDIGGCPATEAKAGLIAGTLALSTSAVSITILQPGQSEPVTIELPPLDEGLPELETPGADDDPLFEIANSSAEAATPSAGQRRDVQQPRRDSFDANVEHFRERRVPRPVLVDWDCFREPDPERAW